MNNSFASIFGLIFLAVSGYLMWNNFEFPSILFGETVKTEGKIIDTDIRPGPGGHGFVQNITYAYQKDGIYYFEKKSMEQRYSSQQVGNRLLIEYQKDNPERNNIVGYYNDYSRKNEKSYLSNKENGYIEISIVNNIFFFYEYADYGVLMDKMIGESFHINDTIVVTPYSKNDTIQHYDQIKYLLSLDSNDQEQLMNLTSKIVYH